MNQHRCETCKNCNKNPNDDNFCLIMNDEIDFTDFEHTAKVGCASHSDFQSGWDTVLDEVLQLPQRREQPNGSMYIYVNDVKALRQKAGEPRMCDRISFQPVPEAVKTAEQLYKEWREKNQHDQTESELHPKSTD